MKTSQLTKEIIWYITNGWTRNEIATPYNWDEELDEIKQSFPEMYKLVKQVKNLKEFYDKYG